MLLDGSIGQLLLTESPILLAAVLVFILAATRVAARPGPGMLALSAAVALGLGAIVRIGGLYLLLENRREWGISYESAWFDVVGWSSTILTALAFVLLVMAFLLSSARPRQHPAPRWAPPPGPYGPPQ